MENNNFKIGDKVKHRFRDWYQKCEVIGVESGINGRIKVLAKDSPKYKQIGVKMHIVGFEESISFFASQDLRKIEAQKN
jgi:hypothetical protein